MSNTKRLLFAGYSDDTFGEYASTHDDYDNCASGKPIEYLVCIGKIGVVVTGQYCPGKSGSWMLGVANFDPDYSDAPMPDWPMTLRSNPESGYGFNPILEMIVPSEAEVRCLTREANDDD